MLVARSLLTQSVVPLQREREMTPSSNGEEEESGADEAPGGNGGPDAQVRSQRCASDADAKLTFLFAGVDEGHQSGDFCGQTGWCKYTQSIRWSRPSL